jgi:hemoglobin-like flavoprotein
MAVLETHKKLVQASFGELLPFAEAAAALFYERLFDLDPSLRALFKTNLAEQEHKWLDMIHIAVFGLDYLEQLVPALQLLGERHVGYGVTPDQYATVEAALMWTLEQAFEERFTPEIREAWHTIYELLATTMQQGFTLNT